MANNRRIFRTFATLAAVTATILVCTASSASAASPASGWNRSITHMWGQPVALPKYVIVSNTAPKVDTANQQLDAHEGSIVHDAGLYWMIGNSYICGYEWLHKSTPWCGFRTYSSPDMTHWTNRGQTFAPTAYFQHWCSGMGCFDPRLIRDPSTGAWRMWFNAYNVRSGYMVMSAPSPAGPWRLMPTPNLAVGNNHPGRGNGAGGLFLDSNGVGYLVYTAWTVNGTDVIERLDKHMVTGSGVHTTIPGAVSAEAPSMFRGPDGTYIVTFDAPGCAWCGGVGTGYATAPTAMGPWTIRGSISDLSCNGQASAAVAVLPGVTLWVSDQWTNIMTGPRGPGVKGWTGMSDLTTVGHWNQADASQHWEPLRIGAGGLIAPITCATDVTIPVV